VLHNDLIITNANSYKESAGAFHLVDGSPKMVKNALTGKLQPWKITRAYGCNSIIASENLLTFRSGAAGFYDLLTEGGTGNFGGFKSGCTSNLVVADGVLSAPDYTRTCSCAYQNQTSLALVHMPEMDAWTVSNTLVLDPSAGRVQELGVNLGAPGDRRDPHGLMWLEYPAVAGDAPNLGLEFQGDYALYQDHPTSMAGNALPWVVSSGVEKMTSLRLSLTAQPTSKSESDQAADSAADETEAPAQPTEAPLEPYRVRLHFGSPQHTLNEARVFDLVVPGQAVIENIKVGGDAGPATVRTIDRVLLGDWLEIQFTEKQGHAVLSGIELQRLEN
jgi:hypothetical protein